MTVYRKKQGVNENFVPLQNRVFLTIYRKKQGKFQFVPIFDISLYIYYYIFIF